MDAEKIKEYFLTPQAELRQEEIELTAEQHMFEAAEQVEDQLVDDYVFGRLDPSEREAFETNYLVTETRRLKVAESEGLVRIASDHSGVESSRGVGGARFGSAKALAAAGAAAILVGVSISLWSFSHESPVTVARVDVPQTSLPPELVPITPPTAKSDVPKPATAKSAIQVPKKVVPANITLSPLKFRNGGGDIVILQDDTRVPFRLKLETDAGAKIFSDCLVRIETPEGKLISSNIKIVQTKRDSLTISVTGKFEPGTYIVYLTGVDKEGEQQPLEEYQFRVIER